jgi:hypothetical protein
MGTTNNGERQTTGNDKWQGMTIGGERQTAGNDKQQGTVNDGERRATGNNKQQGTTNSGEQQTNERQQDHPRYKREMVGLFSFSFSFSFSNFHSSYTAPLRATACRVFMYLFISYT